MSSQSATALPRHIMAEHAIVEGIRSGRFKPGDRLPNDRDLSRSLGVAPLTLQHAMRRLSQQGTLERRPRVGTFVRSAVAVAAPHAAILILNCERIEQSFAPGLLDEIAQVAQAAGRQIRPLLVLDPRPPVTQLYQELKAMRVGALGLLSFLNTDRAYLEPLTQLFPCVLMNKRLAGLPLPCAEPDMFAAARLIVEHFAARGRRRITVGMLNVHHQRSIDLGAALQAECARAGLAVDRRLWGETDCFNPKVAAEWAARVAEVPDLPDGLVLNGVAAAQRLIDRLLQRGIRIGRDLDVVTLRPKGVDLDPASPWSTLLFDDRGATLAAVGMLLDILDGKQAREAVPVVRLQPELVVPCVAVESAP